MLLSPKTKKNIQPWVKSVGWKGDRKDPRERLIMIAVQHQEELDSYQGWKFGHLIKDTRLKISNTHAYPQHLHKYANDRRQKNKRYKREGTLPDQVFDDELRNYFVDNTYLSLLSTTYQIKYHH